MSLTFRSVESLKRKDSGILRSKEFCLQTAFRLKTATPTLDGISSLPSCPPEFRLASPTIPWANPYNKSLSLHTQTHIHSHAHILLVLFLSLTYHVNAKTSCKKSSDAPGTARWWPSYHRSSTGVSSTIPCSTRECPVHLRRGQPPRCSWWSGYCT